MGGTKAGVSGRTPALKGPSEFAKGILTGPVPASKEKHVSLTEPLLAFCTPGEAAGSAPGSKAGAQAASHCSTWQVAGPVPPNVGIRVQTGRFVLRKPGNQGQAALLTAHSRDLCIRAVKLSLQEKPNFSKPGGEGGGCSCSASPHRSVM